MKHASAMALKQLAPLIAKLRALPALVERTPGCFYRRSGAFLHFHEDPAGLFADAKLDFQRFERHRVSTRTEQSAFFEAVAAVLGGEVRQAMPEDMALGSPAVTLVRAYLRALEAGIVGDELARFFTADAEQVELPNRLNPAGGRSDLPTLLKRAEQGRGLLRSQTYEVQSVVEQEGRVAVEATWNGVLAVAVGSLPAGSSMTAHFAMFFELRDGRIARQRNYDCFEPW